MKNELMIFKNEEFGQVRTVIIKGEPWFVGKDIAEKLGYKKPRNAITSHVDKEDKKVAPIQGDLGGTQEMIIINESGLYCLILSSKLPQAKEFKKWVTSEVLPSLRKNGTYSITTPTINSNLTDLVQSTITNIVPLIANEMGKVVLQSQQKIDQTIELLHDQSVIYEDDREEIKSLIGFRSVNTSKMVNYIKEKLYDKLGYKVYANNPIFKKIKQIVFKEFNVIKWEDIPVQKFNAVFAFIDTYIDDLDIK
ncbi:Bro-N domain-containing protein [Clostridium botulinum]|uniref:BRO-N domain-containing protein n=1 Tax=Clostridium botulinum TaxID=1491 RepID=UPI001C9A5020|nr:Bro-N domain-containing protein [Clostridium botulinum]MBY6838845.1 phage antirepressor Ant [Clostridium botulinum]